MATTKITGKDLKQLGFPEGKVIGIAIRTVAEGYKGKSRKMKLDLLKNVIKTPAFYTSHEILGPMAKALLVKKENIEAIDLLKNRIDYQVYGASGIDFGAINQMEIAMKLPVAKAGALMPDAHHGYGLPIGGVLATENSVIPYGVGVDIGCRMCMSIYDINAGYIHQNTDELRELLLDNTRFGRAVFKKPVNHEVLDRTEFSEINVIKSLKDRAWTQIGSSGGGNHFVEFGIAEILDEKNEMGLPIGKYVSVLSHSGSRGLGATIAKHYTKLAMDKCRLPGEAKHLAWLDLDSEDGIEYWMGMTLAGDYASACHHQIHDRMAASLGQRPLAMVENHHNFAWKEFDADGKEWIVHRKGATPAGKGILGIIPGSMTSPGFIVRGKGIAESINSASHGAGRVMSRRQAKETLSKREVKKHLKKSGITLIGSGLDEAPMVYKDIHQVMDAQRELVDVIGSFTPRVVRMCGDEKFGELD